MALGTACAQLEKMASASFIQLVSKQRPCDSSCEASDSEWLMVPPSTHAHSSQTGHEASLSATAVASCAKTMTITHGKRLVGVVEAMQKQKEIGRVSVRGAM